MSGTEISIYSDAAALAIIPKLGEAFAKSSMFGAKTLEQGIMLALHCAVTRQSPFTIKQSYHLIDGDLSMRADAMLAGFHNLGGKHRQLKRDADGAAIELAFGTEKYIYSLSWDEAQKERFPFAKDGKSLKANWATPRQRMQMMWARVVSDGVRAMTPEVCCGLYTPEEVSDFHEDDANGSCGQRIVDSTATVAPEAKKAKAKETKAAQPAAIETTATAVVQSPIPAAQVATTEAVTPPAATTPPAGEIVDAEYTVEPVQVVEESQVEIIANLVRQAGPGLTAEMWQKAMELIGCPVDPTDGKRKVRLATPMQAKQLEEWLQKKLQKFQQATVGTQLEQWASGVADKTAGNAPTATTAG